MTALEAIVSDLAVIVEQCRWAHVHGYWKAGRGLDREHGADLSRTETERLAGPTFDLEIGDHNARQAYQHAISAVARADVLLASLVTHPQPKLVRLTPFSRPDDLAKVAKAAAWRAQHATVHNPRRIATIRQGLDRAVRGLSKALGDGKTDHVQTAEVLCRTCRIRERATRTLDDGSSRPNSSECETCLQWRRRNGHPRPTSLDSGPLLEARAAQARRRARGEDYGAA